MTAEQYAEFVKELLTGDHDDNPAVMAGLDSATHRSRVGGCK